MTRSSSMPAVDAAGGAPPFVLSYQPSLEMARRVSSRYLLRAHGGQLLALTFVGLAAVILFRREPWLSGLFSGVTLAYLGNFVTTRRLALRDARKLQGSSMELTMDAEGIAFHSPGISSRIAWGELARADRTREVWILALRLSRSPIFVPRSALSRAAEGFLVDRLRAFRIPLVDGGTFFEAKSPSP